jgi:hypothetical protein
MQSSFTMSMAEDGERQTFEWVLVSSYPDALWKIVEVGSVSCFPSTGSVTTN